MRIGTTDYWYIKTEEEWQGALDANAYEECIFSDAVPGREKLWREFEGQGIYHIRRFLNNPCEYGIRSSKLGQEVLCVLLEDAKELMVAIYVWLYCARSAEGLLGATPDEPVTVGEGGAE